MLHVLLGTPQGKAARSLYWASFVKIIFDFCPTTTALIVGKFYPRVFPQYVNDQVEGGAGQVHEIVKQKFHFLFLSTGERTSCGQKQKTKT